MNDVFYRTKRPFEILFIIQCNSMLLQAYNIHTTQMYTRRRYRAKNIFIFFTRIENGHDAVPNSKT